MIKKRVNDAIIVKGFYFDNCNIGEQDLYNQITTEPKFANYIQGFKIEAIEYQLVPNSNQKTYSSLTNSYVENISYTTDFNISLSTLVSEQDTLNPLDAQIKGYELRIIYNTIERNYPSETPLFYNDIRLPYFTNILDVQSENIEFIEE
jgi:hypothetical protein